jgi:hypothetical protein
MDLRLFAHPPEQHHRRWIDACPHRKTIMNAPPGTEIKYVSPLKKNGS